MNFSRTWVVALAAAAVGAASAAGADPGGTFTLVASLQHDYRTVEHLDGAFFGGPIEGTSTVVESSGGAFAVGGHSLVTCVAHGTRSAAGLEIETACTLTGADGDQLYMLAKRQSGDVEAGGGGAGGIELRGGTGTYAGVTGRCAYANDYLAGNRVISTARCEWQQSVAGN